MGFSQFSRQLVRVIKMWIYFILLIVQLFHFGCGVKLGTCYQDGNCRLPSCFCGGKSAPGNLEPSEIPQMIMFSFDDAVTGEIYEMYEKLFSRGRLNPNGCPITMTTFVSHNFTDYKLVRSLFRKGHEIAVHSVTHRTPTTFWKQASYNQLQYEIVEQRSIIAENAGVPVRNITGWRSPFLQPSGDIQFTLLQENGFEYDSTLTIATEKGFSAKRWPNTMDFGWQLDCNVLPCPFGKYPGMWEVPVQMLEVGDSGNGCLYADSCRPTTMEEAFQLFWVNFHNHYTGSRSPLFFTMHPSWLREEHNMKALNYFFLTILHYYHDVYFVTYQQHLAWMKNPTPLSDILRFAPWKCDHLRYEPETDKDGNGHNGVSSISNCFPYLFLVLSTFPLIYTKIFFDKYCLLY